MMFLEYFIWGAWYVTLGTWLSGSLHFTGQQIGLAAGATAVGAIIAPFFVGLIADTLFATQRVLSLLHLAGGAILLVASTQTSFTAFYVLILLYCLCFMPTLSLTNALAFRQMQDPEQEFGAIRLLGSLGWIAAGLLIGTMRLEATALPMRLAGLSSLVMGFYCLTLPATSSLSTRTGRFLCRHISSGSICTLEGAIDSDFCHCLLLYLHTAAVLLRLHESFSQPDRCAECSGQDDRRPDVRTVLHGADPLVLPAAWRQIHAGSWYGRVGHPLSVVRLWQSDQRHVDAMGRHPAAWHLL
jgi:MFS family permease